MTRPNLFGIVGENTNAGWSQKFKADKFQFFLVFIYNRAKAQGHFQKFNGTVAA